MLTQESLNQLVECTSGLVGRLPALYPSKEFVAAGELMTYGISYPDLYFRAASFVDKIFKGAKPGETPSGCFVTFTSAA